jgi:hypothetical protein
MKETNEREDFMSSRSRAETFFVSIASYRDPELVPTIADCLARARA